MNFFRVQSAVVSGIHVVPIQVECVQSRRLPYLQVLGASAGSAAELRERVRAALEASGFRLPARRITVQMLPGVHHLPLESLDLAVALAILGSSDQIPRARLEKVLVCGGLGLDGRICSTGNPSAIRRLLDSGKFASAFVPWEESELWEEAWLRAGGGFRHLAEVVDYLRAPLRPGGKILRARENECEAPPPCEIWSRIPGQEVPKRGLEIAAAGAHHLLLQGSNAAHPDLLAHALSSLLPPLGRSETEEVSAIYALAGIKFPPSRPFHVFGSSLGLPSLLPDRRWGKIEEVLLAHRGVLYVDRIAEREPRLFPALCPLLSEGTLPLRLGRIHWEVPAALILVAHLNSCSCGAKDSPEEACACRPTEAKRYERRLASLRRQPFDLHVVLQPEAGMSSEQDMPLVRAARVQAAREQMWHRQRNWNGRLTEAESLRAKPWSEGAHRLWQVLQAKAERGRQKTDALARVALTVSDLRKGEAVEEADLLEAKHYVGVGALGSGGRRVPRVSVSAKNSMATP